MDDLIRIAKIDTTVPEGVRQFAGKITVQPGDSLFIIAKIYGVTAESILWANYDLLFNDDPTFLKEGWILTIPPTNGIYYKWKAGDTIEKIAEKYYADPNEIITWPGNHLDISNPITDNLTDVNVMIPGGYRDMVSWIQTVSFFTKIRRHPIHCWPWRLYYARNWACGVYIFPMADKQSLPFRF